ncbi:hypothetical protein RHMOL_Rhmol04G0044200 [Rhododendron molle]|uniref:Uncharacterized protein n=1 Tax=Rhododendron molle TaxID=49168 RepID=A0ACC0NY87_RHOML|nr:hypothetical protein RHMOL_Rhmol04G0044200 [Rhododendron molle]
MRRGRCGHRRRPRGSWWRSCRRSSHWAPQTTVASALGAVGEAWWCRGTSAFGAGGGDWW